MSIYAHGTGAVVTCSNCGGKGHVFVCGYDGMKRPIVCRGCNGTGTQTVRAV